MTSPVPPAQAKQHLVQAIRAHDEFTVFFSKSKERALFAGWHFANWMMAHPGATQKELLETIADQINERTVRRYMEFTSLVLEWAKKAHPRASEEKLLEFGKMMVMESPKPFTALLREVGQLVNPQFEHDPVKHQEKRFAAENGQLEFAFGTKTVAVLKALPEIGAATWARFDRADLEMAKAKAEQLLAGINAALEEGSSTKALLGGTKEHEAE